MSDTKSRRIEREFGVPVPGEILPPDQWAQTALKNLPSRPTDWTVVFGRAAPLILDLGCGNGRFLLGSGLLRPEFNHVGIDILPLVIRYATRRGNQRGLHHVRFAVCDAQRFLGDYVAESSAREIHCYHPQPYYEPAEFHLRLITPAFLALVHSRLEPSGKFFVQTDHPGYWQYIQMILPSFFDFNEQHGSWPDAPKGRTRREVIALRRGLPVYRGIGVTKALEPVTISDLVSKLPPPTFEADRRLWELDKLEAGN